MAKNHDTKRAAKKAPQKTLLQKREEKRAKKNKSSTAMT